MNRRMGPQIACVMAVLASGASWAADPPTTADTLQKLHASNQKEIAMGKQAIDRASSEDVKALGRVLVKDHAAGDRQVAKLAKDEGLTLNETLSATDSEMLPVGDGYDAAFAKMMRDDHERDVGPKAQAPPHRHAAHAAQTRGSGPTHRGPQQQVLSARRLGRRATGASAHDANPNASALTLDRKS